MSWAYRIIILYAGFVGIIITLITISSRNKEELVSKDYYAQELKYQDKIDAVSNEKLLPETITHSVNASAIVLYSPLNLLYDLNGEIYFFCPSDSRNDKRLRMNFNKEGIQLINKSVLQPGIYKMKLSWKNSDKNYYREEVITIK